MSNGNGEALTQAAEFDLSAAVIPLLKGVVYREQHPHVWSALLDLQARVRDYVKVMGLELWLDEAEGYAFLRSHPDDEEDEEAKLPRLVARRPLSFPVSLLLALLRKKLAEFDARGGDTRLVISREEVVDMLRVFLPDATNEARLIDQVDSHLNKLIDLGFVRSMRGQTSTYEVRRILKAYVDAQWLGELDERLAEYQAQLATDAKDASDE